MLAYTGVLTNSLPGLTHPQALTVNFAGNAVSNVVPFGGAVGVGATYAIDLSWGFSMPTVTLSILVSGVWNVFAKLVMPVIALVLLSPPAGRRATWCPDDHRPVRPRRGGDGAGPGDAQRGPGHASGPSASGRHAGEPLASGVRRPPTSRRRTRVPSLQHRPAPHPVVAPHAVGDVYNLASSCAAACVRAVGEGADHSDGSRSSPPSPSPACWRPSLHAERGGLRGDRRGGCAHRVRRQRCRGAAAVFLFRGFTYLAEIPVGAGRLGRVGHPRSWRRPIGSADVPVRPRSASARQLCGGRRAGRGAPGRGQHESGRSPRRRQRPPTPPPGRRSPRAGRRRRRAGPRRP